MYGYHKLAVCSNHVPDSLPLREMVASPRSTKDSIGAWTRFLAFPLGSDPTFVSAVHPLRTGLNVLTLLLDLLDAALVEARIEVVVPLPRTTLSWARGGWMRVGELGLNIFPDSDFSERPGSQTGGRAKMAFHISRKT